MRFEEIVKEDARRCFYEWIAIGGDDAFAMLRLSREAMANGETLPEPAEIVKQRLRNYMTVDEVEIAFPLLINHVEIIFNTLFVSKKNKNRSKKCCANSKVCHNIIVTLSENRKGSETMQRKKVHVTDINGKLLYTRLWDDGSNVLQFDGVSFGFIDRLDAIRYSWQIKDGWKRTSTDI